MLSFLSLFNFFSPSLSFYRRILNSLSSRVYGVSHDIFQLGYVRLAPTLSTVPTSVPRRVEHRANSAPRRSPAAQPSPGPQVFDVGAGYALTWTEVGDARLTNGTPWCGSELGSYGAAPLARWMTWSRV